MSVYSHGGILSGHRNIQARPNHSRVRFPSEQENQENPSKAQDDLTARFQKLSGLGSAQHEARPANAVPAEDSIDPDEEKTVEELLAELGPEEQWTLNPEDANDVQKLLDEAKNALPPSAPTETEANIAGSEATEEVGVVHNGSTNDNSTLSAPIDASTALSGSGSDSTPKASPDEDEEAATYLQQILDEIELEKQQGGSAEDHPNTTDIESRSDGRADEFLPFSLPSTPTSLPPPHATRQLDSSFIDLPSAPSFIPSRKTTASVTQTKSPRFTDEEIDSWCIICSDDATVKCLGCDGELYCAKCWREGHVGKDVGFEERGHRWVKYRRK